MPDHKNMDVTKNDPAMDILAEQQVRAALRRVDAPNGFTERLMARVEALPETRAQRAKQGGGRGVLVRMTQPAWRLAYAAAAMLAISAGALHVEHARAEQRKADAAAAQFDTAIQVTNHALDQVSAKLQTTEFGAVQRALEANGGGR
ncbi:hypothetical protein [Terriglobus aquaticus]|uniref:DUF3618 domain-containing protein n=1 Tax=Terriglobus aquaticus TaxID=940139 RepID=A0ABW9KP14_9BACT|nr:hypothetical protein [Terriglobus aquaticus]